MTEAIVQINERLRAAARAGEPVAEFFCECGDCLAESVSLSLDGYEEIRDREDLIFAPGHEAPRRYRQPGPGHRAGALGAAQRDVLITALIRAGATRPGLRTLTRA